MWGSKKEREGGGEGRGGEERRGEERIVYTVNSPLQAHRREEGHRVAGALLAKEEQDSLFLHFIKLPPASPCCFCSSTRLAYRASKEEVFKSFYRIAQGLSSPRAGLTAVP